MNGSELAAVHSDFSGTKFFQDAGAIAVSFDGDTAALEQGEPCIAQRGVFCHDKVLAEADVGTAACDEGWTVREVVNGAEVAAEHHGGVIKEA